MVTPTTKSIAAVIKHLAGRHDQRKHASATATHSDNGLLTAAKQALPYAIEAVKIGAGILSYVGYVALVINAAPAVGAALGVHTLAVALPAVYAGLTPLLYRNVKTVLEIKKLAKIHSDFSKPCSYLNIGASVKRDQLLVTGNNKKSVDFCNSAIDTLPKEVASWLESKKMRVHAYPFGSEDLWGFLSLRNPNTLCINTNASKIAGVSPTGVGIDITPMPKVIGAVIAHESLHCRIRQRETKLGVSTTDQINRSKSFSDPGFLEFYKNMDAVQKVGLALTYPTIAPSFYTAPIKKLTSQPDDYKTWRATHISDRIGNEGAAFMLSDYLSMANPIFNLKYSRRSRIAWSNYMKQTHKFNASESIIKSYTNTESGDSNSLFTVVCTESDARYYVGSSSLSQLAAQ